MSKETGDLKKAKDTLTFLYNFLGPVVLLAFLQYADYFEADSYDTQFKYWLVLASTVPFIPSATLGLLKSFIESGSKDKTNEGVFLFISSMLLATLFGFSAYTNNENGWINENVFLSNSEVIQNFTSGGIALFPALYFTFFNKKKDK